ncbi:MAG: aspartate carbamoyltransferase catalytic subunit [Bacteroidota bacterium]|jgi:aspartate carbamoyltransferase catalytic subunit|nr:aspartate carbamoyltransferase catalytic subunit [Bacteroidota bacterium]
MSSLSIPHLLGLHGVPRSDLELILDSTDTFLEILDRPIKKVPTLQGVTVVNLFFENSTRTRISFELAERRLSADVVNFSASTSSVKKGETLLDTARNIEAMKVDIVVMRHAAAGSVKFLSERCTSRFLNAGDGAHEHPTQALLDMVSIRQKTGTLEGLNVCIVGDIAHSRVARSNIYGLLTMGANVGVCGPASMIPYRLEELGVRVFTTIEAALDWSDVINVLRIQLERDAGADFPSLREYHNAYGVTRRRLDTLSKDLIILHPGPINRGVEIESEVADGPSSVILPQVTNGVAIRMAVLYLIGTRAE